MCTLTILIRVSLVATRTNRYVVVARNAISSSLIDDMKIARGARISKFHKWNDTIESGVSSPWYLDSIRERNACDFESKLDTHAMRATDLRRERERERERERAVSLSLTNYKLRHYFDSQHSAWSYARSTVPSCNIDDPPRIKCPMIALTQPVTLTGILIAKRVRATDFQWMGSEFKLWLYPRVA